MGWPWTWRKWAGPMVWYALAHWLNFVFGFRVIFAIEIKPDRNCSHPGISNVNSWPDQNPAEHFRVRDDFFFSPGGFDLTFSTRLIDGLGSSRNQNFYYINLTRIWSNPMPKYIFYFFSFARVSNSCSLLRCMMFLTNWGTYVQNTPKS